MALVKTYLLAPNFNFRPDGPIAIGNIIAHPLRPKRVLTSFDPSKPKPVIETAIDYDYVTNRTRGRGVELGVWAQFLQTVGGKVGVKSDKDVSTEYKIDRMETSYLKVEPTDEEIAERVKAPRVQNAIRSGTFRSQPVFMITGVKIAKGFAASHERASNRGCSMGTSVPISAEISVGADVNLSAQSSEREAFRAGDDIVFAYQLMKIVQKGWKEKTVSFDDYYPNAAYLNNDSEEEAEEKQGEMMAIPITAVDLSEVVGQEAPLHKAEIQDGQSTCLCISFKEQ